MRFAPRRVGSTTAHRFSISLTRYGLEAMLGKIAIALPDLKRVRAPSVRCSASGRADLCLLGFAHGNVSVSDKRLIEPFKQPPAGNSSSNPLKWHRIAGAIYQGRIGAERRWVTTVTDRPGFVSRYISPTIRELYHANRMECLSITDRRIFRTVCFDIDRETFDLSCDSNLLFARSFVNLIILTIVFEETCGFSYFVDSQSLPDVDQFRKYHLVWDNAV